MRDRVGKRDDRGRLAEQRRQGPNSHEIGVYENHLLGGPGPGKHRLQEVGRNAPVHLDDLGMRHEQFPLPPSEPTVGDEKWIHVPLETERVEERDEPDKVRLVRDRVEGDRAHSHSSTPCG